MTANLLNHRKFNLLLVILFASWFMAHVWIMHEVFKFSWFTSLWDSVIFNSTLAFCVILINLILVFYKPANKSLWISLSMVLALTYLWVSKSSLLFSFIKIPETNHAAFVEQSISLRFVFGLMINLGVLALCWFWYGIEEQLESSKRKQKIEALAREAELLSLRQKLQPHFLFNSLNSISALIIVKPEQARVMIHQLSDFLRSTLRQEENKKISIEEELQQLDLYLSIEKVRFGHRLNTVIEKEEDITGNVPAMILQPVVENAIKFGLYDTTGDVLISIKVHQEKKNIYIEVSNPYDPETRSANDKGTGFGLTSIKRRLYLLYARNDLLITEENEGKYFTKIIIPQ